jgi:sugar lactone lactonase YvrE
MDAMTRKYEVHPFRGASVRVALLATSAAVVLAGCGSPSAPPVRAAQITTVAGGDVLENGVAPTSSTLLGIASVAIDPRDGTLYFTDSTRHIVGSITADGKRLDVIGGTHIGEFNGDGKPPAQTSFHVPNQIAVHPTRGDLYVADTNNYRVRMISADRSVVKTVAGSGVKNFPDSKLPTEVPFGAGLTFGHFSGDGGPAAAAELNMPVGVAIDASDVLFISDAANFRIRAVNLGSAPASVAGVQIAPGNIQTIAGTGSFGNGGDGGPATKAQLAYPKAVALDTAGNLVFVDSVNKRVRRINRKSGIIETVATAGRPNDDPLKLLAVEGVAVAANGDVYFSDLNRHAIFRRPASAGPELVTSPPRNRASAGLPSINLPRGRDIHLVAGVGVPGLAGANETVQHAVISSPGALSVGRNGDLFFVESGNNLLRKLAAGAITTIAGTGPSLGATPADKAVFSVLAPVTVAPNGDVYVGDINLHAIRRIRADNRVIETYAGTGKQTIGGNGLPPEQADFIEPAPRFLGDTMYIVEPQGCVVRRVVNGKIEHVAGTGHFGREGEGGPAATAQLSLPIGIGLHPKSGEVHITNLWLPRVQRIDKSGILHTVAGNGTDGFSGDGGPAARAQLNYPTAVAFKKDGTMFIADFMNNRIRMVDLSGTITTLAGTGDRGFSGDGGPAKDAQLWGPNDLAVDAEDNLYVTDSNNHRIRKIEPAPPYRISTVVGTGDRGFSGDGGPPTAARLSVPRGLSFGPDGALYFTDSLNRRVRVVRF